MSSQRPRGFIDDWKPRPDTLDLVRQVQGILDFNQDILPLTLRQIYYALVSNHGFDKTEQAYSRLCETMNRTRRARLISMDCIRDDGFRDLVPPGWENENALISAAIESAKQFRLDRQEGQERRILLWCEAAGMAPQLQSAADPYGVPVVSSGGFDSLTSKHEMARRIAGYGKAEILHIGDHDPSGVYIAMSLDQDLRAFLKHYGGDIKFTRLDVTPAQIRDLGLPTAPPKRTDRRRFEGETTQCEAIPARQLRQIVIDAIQDRLNLGEYQAQLERESVIRDRLTPKFEALRESGI
jgi:hypothetical protein